VNTHHSHPLLLRFRDLTKTVSNSQPLLDIEEFAIPVGACVLLSGRNGRRDAAGVHGQA
jgi:ABC-type multidrug transport system ATPase subunit